jgi:hypothetical protein
MTDWKPIDTAPKERAFLGFLQDHLTSRIEICAWNTSKKRFVPMSYSSSPHLWLAEMKTKGVKITHWMPLPACDDKLEGA